jgi:hypothetical protein
MSDRPAPELNPAGKQRPRRRTGVCSWRTVWLGLALSIIGVRHVRPQITTVSQGSQLPSPQVVGSMPDPNDGPRETDPALEQQRIQAIKIAQHAEIVSDTDKLLKMTARLDAEVEQSHETALTRKQLHTLAKIEKLAKSVKQNMSSLMR